MYTLDFTFNCQPFVFMFELFIGYFLLQFQTSSGGNSCRKFRLTKVKSISIFFRYSEKIDNIKEKDRLRKAKWRKMKKETDPDYVNKVKEYDQEWKRQITSRSSCTSDAPSTPKKQSAPPSYYRVLSTSKKVQNILGPSPNMHTTVLKHVLKKAIKSPRKSSRMPEYSAVGMNFVTPPKDASILKDL